MSTDAANMPASGDLDRARSPYTSSEKIRRLLWNYLGQTAFRLTFHNWYAARRWLLRLFGAQIGAEVRLRPSVIVEQPWNLSIGPNSSIGDRAIIYCLGLVTIGRNVSISQGAHVCAGTHDHTKRELPLLRPPITIGDEVWIAADAFVGPGVRVGDGCVVGARSCVFHDLPPWKVCVGTPAKPVRDRVFECDRGAPLRGSAA
jgi:putative colanic acid biosynthesis acetyltransferase WcaF